ncbi:MAG: site-2 protease family protein [Candidatus Dojkabacteria bacterium]|nr:site-2 protease family protein [Candidatus Dojkabacteria bacterium]
MLPIIVNIILFILVIGVLTFIHELGHFLVAKAIGAKVEEFALGFGPKLLKKTYKGTEYSIRALPLGGFVKIMGDGDPGGKKANIKDKGNLNNKKKIFQVFVMLAGVTMNTIFAIIIYYITIGAVGWRIPVDYDLESFNPTGAYIEREKISDVTYLEVIDGTGAKEAGIPEEGTIKSIGGVEVLYSDELDAIVDEYKGKPIDIEICVEEECGDYKVNVSDDGVLGIGYNHNYYVILSYENGKAFAGFSHIANTLRLMYIKLSSLFSEAKSTGDYSEISNSVSGPIGIYYLIDYFKQFGLITFLSIMADLSLSLAIINILPIPALDGGRVLIITIEGILKKDLNEKVEAAIINTSFILLMILVIFIMIKDIVNIDNIKNMFN